MRREAAGPGKDEPMSEQLLSFYVVANSGHARILAHDSAGFTEILAIDAADLRQNPTDLPWRAGLDFAQTVAETLNDAADLGTFSRLILVAPAKTARAIKAELTRQTTGRLEGEYYTDLAKLPEVELWERLVALTGQPQPR